MSVNSDDTDVLILLPPDLFVVNDDFNEFLPNSDVGYNSCNGSNMLNMRRYGSVDALSPPTRNPLRSRSHQGTPSKYAAPSPHRNMLTTESYIAQKQRDEQNLQEIDNYFKQSSKSNTCESSPVPKLNLPQVQELLSQIDSTDRSIAEKYADSDRPIVSSANARKILSFDSPTKSTCSKIETEPYRNELSVRTDGDSLVSLHGLWSTQPQITKVSLHEELKVLKQRLDEERLRRQHCEDMIKQLQSRLLEMDEKIAVAMQVDNEKNLAIKKLKDSWSKTVSQWKESDSNASALSLQIKTLEERFNDEKSEMLNKVKKYESELLKSLALVHDYKEQQISATDERDATIAEITLLKSQLSIKESDCADKERLLNNNASQLLEKQMEVEKVSNKMRDLQEKLKQCQVEKDHLACERELSITIHKQLSDAMKREEHLKDQLRAASKTKADLKQYYQEQVEKIVAEKQKDFQTQLENAEKKLLNQFELKERDLEAAALRERQSLSESYNREVKIMEEAHHETVEYYKVEVSLCNQKIEDLQLSIARDKERSRAMAHQLYAVFQTQWMETLKLVAPHCDDNEVSGIRAIKRQGTFTMDELGVNFSQRPSAPPHGSSTYRINETPQKIPPPSKQSGVADASSKDRLRMKGDKEKSPVKRALFER